MKLKDEIIGKSFGKLFVKEFVNHDSKHYYYNCVCSCGKNHTTTRNNLITGKTTRCSTCSLENRKNSFIKNNKYTYNTYRSMLLRCSENIRYVNVPICERWLDKEQGFRNFFNDMGPRPENTTLDRIDNSLGYFPENCRWVARGVQNHNKGKRKDSVGKYIGVSSSRGRFISQVTKDGKRLHHRYFDNEEDAAVDYDNVSEILYGDRPNKTIRREVPEPVRKFGSACLCRKTNKYRVRATDYSGKRKTVGFYISQEEAFEVLDLIRQLKSS
jgi:hypothetical protein